MLKPEEIPCLDNGFVVFLISVSAGAACWITAGFS